MDEPLNPSIDTHCHADLPREAIPTARDGEASHAL